jgi:hypothetical protein
MSRRRSLGSKANSAANVRLKRQPIADIRILNHWLSQMVDPYKAIRRRERTTQVVGLLLLIALLSLLTLDWVRSDVRDGENVMAVVERFGTYPDPLGTGDLPILTVRLSNGSIRQVRASWSDVQRCARGSNVSLLQRGTALQVGLKGCGPAQS